MLGGSLLGVERADGSIEMRQQTNVRHRSRNVDRGGRFQAWLARSGLRPFAQRWDEAEGWLPPRKVN